MAGVDRLSALPLELKTSILRLLPIDQAVRTSSLSRSWRHVWTHRTNLFFDFPNSDDPDPHGREVMIRRFKILMRVTSSLQGPLTDLCLNYHAVDYALDLSLALHIILVLKGGLQKLWINNTGRRALLQLPYFQSLRTLCLCDFHLTSLPTDFQGFYHLQVLILISISISQKDIQFLIDRSRNLKVFHGALFLTDLEPLSLIISSPLLTSIRYYFNHTIKEVRVINAPYLENAHISARIGSTSSSEKCASIVTLISKFMADVATVSDFSLDFEALKCLSQVTVSCALRVQFLCLRSLHLVGLTSCLEAGVCATFCCLLRNMPILESLEIKCLDRAVDLEGLNEPDGLQINEYIKKQEGISCLEQSLRRLTISVTKSIPIVVMGMLRFIMLNANVLKLVKIKYMEDSKVEPSVVEELNLVQKASPNVKVVFSSKSARR